MFNILIIGALLTDSNINFLKKITEIQDGRPQKVVSQENASCTITALRRIL